MSRGCRQRLLLIGSCAAALLAAGFPGVSAGQQIPEGCFVTNPATTSPNPCVYTAAGDGAYIGRGEWRLTISRRGTTTVLTDDDAPNSGLPGAIRAGDVVTAEALTPGSHLVVSRTALMGGAGAACTSTGYESGGVAGSGYPNDPLFDAQWGLKQINAPQAWVHARGAGARVAVVDTGVDLAHPDLVERLVPGTDVWETRAGGAGDCPGPQDEQFHGTMVAGVIAAATDNGIGVSGVAPEAELMPVRVRDVVDNSDFSRVGIGIRWAADHGADVISLTGGVAVPVRPGPALQEEIAEAVAYAWERGVVTVATAGNASLPWCQYPAATDHVVCAAANGPDGAPARYSQLPLKLGSGIAVRAPGGARESRCDAAGDILSTTLPGTAWIDECEHRGYATDSGTTYATAHVAGVAALLAGQRLRNHEIVECLRTTSSNAGAYDPITGYGTVDAAAAVRCKRAFGGRAAARRWP